MSIISTARSRRSSAPAGVVSPIEDSTTGQPRAAARSSTSWRSAAAELSSGRAPPAQAGSTRSSPASMTALSDESMDSGTLETGPTTGTSQAIAASRPSTSGEYSSTLRSRYEAPPAIWRAAIQRT